MRIADAVLDAPPIAVPFKDGNVLNVTYRMQQATPAAMSRMIKEADEAEQARKEAGKKGLGIDQAAIDRMVDSMVGLIDSWDLTDVPRDETGEPVPDMPEDVVPITAAALQHVPSHIFGQIMKSVQKDQATSGEGESNSDGG